MKKKKRIIVATVGIFVIFCALCELEFIYGRIAKANFQKGNVKKAVDMVQRQYEFKRKIFGKKSYFTNCTLQELADFYYEKGDLKNAIRCHEEIYKNKPRKSLLENTALYYIYNPSALAHCYISIGDDKKAESLLLSASASSSYDRIAILLSLANLYIMQSDFDKAKKYLDILSNLDDTKLDYFSKMSITLLYCKYHIAIKNYLTAQKYITMYRNNIDEKQSCSNAYMYGQLGRLHYLLGDYVEAINFIESSKQIMQKSCSGIPDAELLFHANLKARSFVKLNKFKEARQALQHVIGNQEKMVSPDLVCSYVYLSSIEKKFENLDKEKEYLNSAYEAQAILKKLGYTNNSLVINNMTEYCEEEYGGVYER